MVDSTRSANSPLFGQFIVLLAATGFSAKAIIVKLAYAYQVNAVVLLALRMLLSLPFFIAMAIWSSRQEKDVRLTSRDWILIAVMGLSGYYLASLFDFLGLQYISAALERLILFLYPTFVVMISAVFFARKITRRDILALLLSYAGIALVFLHDFTLGDEKNVVFGGFLILLSGIFYAIYIVGSGTLVHRLGSLRYTAYASIISCLAVVLQFVFTHDVGELAQPIPVYGYSVAMAVFSTVLPVWLMSEGIRRIGSSTASMIGTVGPVLTIAMGYAFLDEPITLIQMAGAALVVAGVVVISRQRAK